MSRLKILMLIRPVRVGDEALANTFQQKLFERGEGKKGVRVQERGSASGLRSAASDEAITGQVRYIGRAWFDDASFAEPFDGRTVGVNRWKNTILRNEATVIASLWGACCYCGIYHQPETGRAAGKRGGHGDASSL